MEMFSKNEVKKLNEYKKQLDPSYLAVFDEIIVYLRVSYLPERDTELMLQDILSNFLQCQAEGKRVEKVIAQDYKGFCDELIQEYSQNHNSRMRIIWDNAGFVFLALAILVTINFLSNNIVSPLAKGLPIFWQFSVKLDDLIFWVIALMGVWYVMRLVKQQTFVPAVHVSMPGRIMLGLLVASPFIIAIISRQLKINQVVLFTANGLVVIAVVFLLRYGCKWLANR